MTGRSQISAIVAVTTRSWKDGGRTNATLRKGRRRRVACLEPGTLGSNAFAGSHRDAFLKTALDRLSPRSRDGQVTLEFGLKEHIYSRYGEYEKAYVYVQEFPVA